MKKKLIISFLILIGGITQGQTAHLEGQFFEYTTYYISGIDVQTGASTVPLFRYKIVGDSYPLWAKVWFKASMKSPSLNVNEQTTILELESSVIKMKNNIVLDNRNFSSATTMLYDESSPPNPVSITIRIQDILNASEFESMLSSVITTGQLADGEYTFEIKLYSGNSQLDISMTDHETKTIVVQTPSGINLESPGGELADTLQNVVYSPYPVFNWYSAGCTACETSIRVAQFDPIKHSTSEEALDDETVLPFDQMEGWLDIENVSTYQYPISGAKSLEYGHVYVWQVRKMISTTSGIEYLNSPIFTFMLKNPGNSGTQGNTTGPFLNSLRTAMGEDEFNAIFSQGSSLAGFTPSGTYMINNTPIDGASAQHILKMLIEKKYQITSIHVKE